MSVLIRGMEMPLSCWHSCTLKKVTMMGDIYCPLINKYLKRGEIGVRHPDCPLVEVEPHGRLIDATFEENHYASMLLDPTQDVTEQDKHKARIIIEALRMAGTVVEAEGSDG